MDKHKIINELIVLVQDELQKAEEAFASTNALATEGDVKQESKYDTRGIEAGYLAGAQKKRVEELKFDLHKLEELLHFEFKQTDEVVLGSIVTVDMGKMKRTYFISPSFGGVHLNEQGRDLHVITPVSPVGEAMLGLNEGDEFEFDSSKNYTILKIN